MTILQAIVLGLVQGLTEFIPISSTAHLRIVPALLGWDDPGAALSAVIQLGTILAVVIYFARELLAMAYAWFRGIASGHPMETGESRMAWFVVVGSIPVVVLGLTLKDFIETGARSLWIVAASLIFVAVFLAVAEHRARSREKRSLDDLRMIDAVAIGLGQALALIPGMSRSGSTIMVGLFRDLDHSSAARFSFLLGVPAIVGSGLFELVAEWRHLASVGWVPIGVALLVAFASGWASIWALLRFLERHGTWVFIAYRIALGLTIIGLLGTHVL